MTRDDIKAGQVFVETATSARHPKRKPRKVHVQTARVYDAEVVVFEGRGKGDVLSMPLKRLVDPEQWTLELPAVCPRCKDEGHYYAPGDYSPCDNFYCDCPAGKTRRAKDGAPT